MPDMTPVDSKSISAFGYDEEALELHVTFLRSGETYVYTGVEAWRRDELMRAESKGTYIAREIKPNYPFYKL